jgi:hypothetical protein
VSAFAPLTLGALAAGAGLSTGLLVCAGFIACAAVVMTLMPTVRGALPA